MDYYKYWLLKNFENLDIDILEYIKKYAQIKIFQAPTYKDLIKTENYNLIIDGIVFRAYKLYENLFDKLYGIRILIKNDLIQWLFFNYYNYSIDINFKLSGINPKYLKYYENISTSDPIYINGRKDYKNITFIYNPYNLSY